MASLKQREGTATGSDKLMYPWQKCHGLIEASDNLLCGTLSPSYPWQKCHGLIEAT